MSRSFKKPIYRDYRWTKNVGNRIARARWRDTLRNHWCDEDIQFEPIDLIADPWYKDDYSYFYYPKKNQKTYFYGTRNNDGWPWREIRGYDLEDVARARRK